MVTVTASVHVVGWQGIVLKQQVKMDPGSCVGSSLNPVAKHVCLLSLELHVSWPAKVFFIHI